MAICCSCVCTWVIVAAIGYFLYKKFSGMKAVELKKKDWKKDTVYLFQYSRPPKLPNYSPFCLKVEMFLRINNIPYENVFANKERSQHGLLPFIELNGVQTADSQLILELLKEHFKIKTLPSGKDEGFARAVDRFVDLHTFSVLIHYKFKDEVGFVDNLLKVIDIPLKSLLQPVIKPFIKKRVAARINNVVGGALSEAQFHLLLKKDLDALSEILGDQKYLFGDQLHAVDCSVFSQLATVCFLPMPNEIKRIVSAEYPTIQKYLERIVQQVFPTEFA